MTWIEWMQLGLAIAKALQDDDEKAFNVILRSIPGEDKLLDVLHDIEFENVKTTVELIHGVLGTIIGKDKK